jgi:hypothetical protein
MPPAALSKTSAAMTRQAIVRAVRTREGHERGRARDGKGSNGVIGRAGQIPVARQWSASAEVIKNPYPRMRFN